MDEKEFIDLSYIKDEQLVIDFNIIKDQLTNVSEKLAPILKDYVLLRNKFDSYINELNKRNIDIEI